MTEVATRAGVALSTVSRVINRSPLVAPEKRKLVEAVIAETGYQPCPIEKRKGIRKDPTPWIRHHMVRIVLYGRYDLFWITNYAPIYSYALHGIEECLGQYQFRRSTERAENAEEFGRILARGKADGYLVLSTAQDPLPAEFSKYPVVSFMGANPTAGWDNVIPDAEKAGRMAARYLLSKGCGFCVALGGLQPVYEARVRAFRDALAAEGVDSEAILDKKIVRGAPNMHQVNREVISEHLRTRLAKSKKPVGIFSVSDIVTPVIYAEMAQAGRKIGKEVHIVTCNNERPYLDPLHPAPAVIDIQADFIGRRAVRQLLRRLESPQDPHETTLIEPKLILPEQA